MMEQFSLAQRLFCGYDGNFCTQRYWSPKAGQQEPFTAIVANLTARVAINRSEVCAPCARSILYALNVTTFPPYLQKIVPKITTDIIGNASVLFDIARQQGCPADAPPPKVEIRMPVMQSGPVIVGNELDSLFATGTAAASGPVTTATAPVLQSARYSEDGGRIQLVFDVNIQVIDPAQTRKDGSVVAMRRPDPPTCAEVVAAPASGKTGKLWSTPADCTIFPAANILNLVVSPEFLQSGDALAIKTGDNITLLAGMIGKAGTPFTYLANATNNPSLTVALQTTKIDTQIMVKVREAVLAFDEPFVAKIKVLGAAGRALSGVALKLVAAPATLTAAQTAALQSALTDAMMAAVQSGGDLELDNTLTPAGNYSFNATATNFLNSTATVTFGFQRYADGDARVSSLKAARAAALEAAATRPTLLSATWNEDGSGVLLTFDQTVVVYSTGAGGKLVDAQADKGVNCEVVLTNPALSTLPGQLWRTDYPDDCFVVVDHEHMAVILDSDFAADSTNNAILPGNVITLKENVVGNRAATPKLMNSTLSAAMSAVVSAGSSAVTPNIRVAAAEVLPGCANYELSFPGDLGSGGRKFSTATITATTVPDLASAQLLNAYLSKNLEDVLYNGGYFSLTSEMMPAGSYVFTMTLTNYFGKSASKNITVTRYSDNGVPFLLFNPSFHDTLNVEELAEIGAEVEAPTGCTGMDTFTFFWNQTGGPAVSRSMLDGLTTPYLTIPAYTLVANTYYRFAVTLKSTTTGNNFTFPYVFRTAPPILSGTIASQAVGINASFALDASISDTASLSSAFNASRYSCAWSCMDSEGAACFNKFGATLTISSTRCSGVSLSRRLKAGTYIFNATITDTDGNTGSSENAYVTVLNENPIAVKLTPSYTVVTSDVNDYFIAADIASLGPDGEEALQYSWSSLDTCNGKPYTVVDLAKYGSAPQGLGQSTLSIAQAALVAGQSVCIALTVSDPSGVTGSSAGSAQLTFEVLPRPNSGSCKVTGSAVELTTPLTVSCSGWLGAKSILPLSYQFFVGESANGPWTPLSTSSAASSLSVVLPAGTYFVLPTIEGKGGSAAVAQKAISVTVTKSTRRKRDTAGVARSFLAKSQNTTDTNGNVASGMSDLAKVSVSKEYFQDANFANQSSAYYSRLVSRLTMLPPASSEAYSKIGFTVASQVQGGPGASASTADQTFETLLMLVNTTVSSGKASGTCASDETIQTWFKTLNTFYTDKMSDKMKAKVYGLYRLVSDCQAISMRCQAPNKLNQATAGVNQTVGNVAIGANTQVGNFNASGLTGALGLPPKSNDTNCIRFSQTDFKVTIKGAGRYARDLSLRNGTTEVPIASSKGAVFKFTIPLEADVAAQMKAGKINATCAYLKFADESNPDLTSATLSTDGVTTGALDTAAGELACTSTHLSTFVVSTVDASSTSSPKSAPAGVRSVLMSGRGVVAAALTFLLGGGVSSWLLATGA